MILGGVERTSAIILTLSSLRHAHAVVLYTAQAFNMLFVGILHNDRGCMIYSSKIQVRVHHCGYNTVGYQMSRIPAPSQVLDDVCGKASFKLRTFITILLVRHMTGLEARVISQFRAASCRCRV